jgi:thymidylate kinase
MFLMSRLFIIEGVDSTGKSTLARTLALERQAVYLHASGHRDLHDSMFAHHKNLLEIAEVNLQMGHDVVMDRHWPSEYAYAGVLRHDKFNQYNFEEMRLHCHRLNTIYIWANSPSFTRYEATHKNHDTKVFHHLSEADFLAIQNRYEQMFKWPYGFVVAKSYNLTKDGEHIERFIANL